VLCFWPVGPTTCHQISGDATVLQRYECKGCPRAPNPSGLRDRWEAVASSRCSIERGVREDRFGGLLIRGVSTRNSLRHARGTLPFLLAVLHSKASSGIGRHDHSNLKPGVQDLKRPNRGPASTPGRAGLYPHYCSRGTLKCSQRRGLATSTAPICAPRAAYPRYRGDLGYFPSGITSDIGDLGARRHHDTDSSGAFRLTPCISRLVST